MEIRQLTADDLPSLLQLYRQLDQDNASISLEKSTVLWETEIASDPNICYFGAVEQNIVVSTCYAVLIPNLTNGNRSICFVENVVTDEKYRRQGLARKVIEAAVAFAKAHHCYKVILQSGVKRTEAHRFYESIGFDGSTKKAFDMRLPDTKSL